MPSIERFPAYVSLQRFLLTGGEFLAFYIEVTNDKTFAVGYDSGCGSHGNNVCPYIPQGLQMLCNLQMSCNHTADNNSLLRLAITPVKLIDI